MLTGHWQLLELLPRWDEDEIVLSFKLLLLSLFDELPVVTSTPITTATQGSPYSYTITA